MTTEAKISRIQFRRGDLVDLPILNEGEPGYSMDRKRLFIGNEKQLIESDGSASYELNFKIAKPNQVIVFVDDTQKTSGVHFTVQGTTLTFNSPVPTVGAVIEVGYNTEILLDRAEQVMDILPLQASVTDQQIGFYFDTTLYNTAVIDYSFKDSAGNMAVGEIRMITDGITVSVNDTSNFLGTSVFSWNGQIDMDGLFQLTYTNATANTGNFYYTYRLWNTI